MTFAIRDLLDIVGTAELHCYRGVWTLRKAYVPPYARGRGHHKRLVSCGFRFVKRPMRVFDGVKHVLLERRFARS